MTKKNTTSTLPEFQVKFHVNALVGLSIHAKTYEDALASAKNIMNNMPLFNPKLEFIDGKIELSGFDNLDDWNNL